MNSFDQVLFQWFNSWAGISNLIDGIIIFLATYLWYIVMAAIGFLLLVVFLPRFHHFRKRHAELFIFAFTSAFIARFIITGLIRFFYDRARPFEAVESVRQLIAHSPGHAFPSGHASLAFAVAAAVAFYYPKTSIAFFTAAALIGIGRIAAGIHWPGDIVAGALVGIVTAWIFYWSKTALRRY